MKKSKHGVQAVTQNQEQPSTPLADHRELFGAHTRATSDLPGPIAAVGNNTGSSGEHAYVIGFGYAAQVLLHSLTRRTLNGDEFIPEDALIHPIAYSARHFVELFLKDIPREVHRLRDRDTDAADGHDLRRLWPMFEQACDTDSRLAGFPAELCSAVFSIADLDPTGQTFRYRRSTDKQVHLDKFAVISVQEFEQDFLQMFETVKDLYNKLEGLQFEYMLGTFTATLSRTDLFDIAERIGAAVEGGKAALSAAEVEIRGIYSLSRRQYAEARAVIEKHYRLSQLAGKERPLRELPLETLGVAVFAIFEEEAAALLSESEVAAIWGVLYSGDSLGAGEDYDHQVKAFLEGRIPTSREDVLRELRNKPTHLRRGLVRLGQPTLIAALDAIVPSDEIQQFQDCRRRN